MYSKKEKKQNFMLESIRRLHSIFLHKAACTTPKGNNLSVRSENKLVMQKGKAKNSAFLYLRLGGRKEKISPWELNSKQVCSLN